MLLCTRNGLNKALGSISPFQKFYFQKRQARSGRGLPLSPLNGNRFNEGGVDGKGGIIDFA